MQTENRAFWIFARFLGPRAILHKFCGGPPTFWRHQRSERAMYHQNMQISDSRTRILGLGFAFPHAHARIGYGLWSTDCRL